MDGDNALQMMADATFSTQDQDRLTCKPRPQVQMDIREGHAETVAKVLRMIDADGGIKGKSCCDVGCGTGSLSLPLAQRVHS